MKVPVRKEYSVLFNAMKNEVRELELEIIKSQSEIMRKNERLNILQDALRETEKICMEHDAVN